MFRQIRIRLPLVGDSLKIVVTWQTEQPFALRINVVAIEKAFTVRGNHPKRAILDKACLQNNYLKKLGL